MKIETGGGAAWRGIYISRSKHKLQQHPQIFRAVIDPHGHAGLIQPSLEVAFFYYHKVRLPLPYVPWRWCMATGYARPVTWLYRLSQWFWHGMDGRYGWFGSCRRKGRR